MGSWGPACCRTLLGSHAHLRSSSLLALTKLMAIDPDFCDANLALIFTLLEKRQVNLQACTCCTAAVASMLLVLKHGLGKPSMILPVCAILVSLPLCCLCLHRPCMTMCAAR